MARRNRQARLTERASDAWDAALRRQGVTYTALLEALGELLADGVDWVPPEAVTRARELDRQRYSRRER